MNSTVANTGATERTEWFDTLVATLRTHELQLETNTASEELRRFYANLMGNNLDEFLKTSKATAQQYFVSKIIFEFLKSLDNNLPSKLAFDYNDSEVLVWAEIEDDNALQEKMLMRAASRINAAYHGYGFDMETMIVEKSDGLSVPNHYSVYKA